MPKLKLLRRTLDDPKGRLGKIKALILNEALERENSNMSKALVMVSNDISAIVIDCIERTHCDNCLFFKRGTQKGGDGE